jgi:hypothetical protein
MLVGADLQAVNSNDQVGVVYLYAQTNGIWPTIPTMVFPDPGGNANDNYGSVLAISADGSTILIGTGGGSANDTSAYLYTEVNGSWSTTPTVTFTDPGNSGGDCFGCSVTLSADGQIALIGSLYTLVNGKAAGVVYLYNQSNGVWPTIPTAVLNDPGVLSGDTFGLSTAISADKSTILAGTPQIAMDVHCGGSLDDCSGTGTAYVFGPPGSLPTPKQSSGGGGSYGLGLLLIMSSFLLLRRRAV